MGCFKADYASLLALHLNNASAEHDAPLRLHFLETWAEQEVCPAVLAHPPSLAGERRIWLFTSY